MPKIQLPPHSQPNTKQNNHQNGSIPDDNLDILGRVHVLIDVDDESDDQSGVDDDNTRLSTKHPHHERKITSQTVPQTKTTPLTKTPSHHNTKYHSLDKSQSTISSKSDQDISYCEKIYSLVKAILTISCVIIPILLIIITYHATIKTFYDNLQQLVTVSDYSRSLGSSLKNIRKRMDGGDEESDLVRRNNKDPFDGLVLGKWYNYDYDKDIEALPNSAFYTKIPYNINQNYKKTIMYQNLIKSGGNGYPNEPLMSVIRREYPQYLELLYISTNTTASYPFNQMALLDVSSDESSLLPLRTRELSDQERDFLQYYPNKSPDLLDTRWFDFIPSKTTFDTSKQPPESINKASSQQEQSINKASSQEQQQSNDNTPSFRDPFSSHPLFTPINHFPSIASRVTPIDETRYSPKLRENLSLQPLPPNRFGHRYFITRRDLVPYPSKWHNTLGRTQMLGQHQAIMSCFGQWFPKTMIEKYRQEMIEKRLPDSYIDLNYINKTELANAFGYDSYDEMPYHPRVPLKTNNDNNNNDNVSSTNDNINNNASSKSFQSTPSSKESSMADSGWEIHCTTRWKVSDKYSEDQHPGYYSHFYPTSDIWAGHTNRRGTGWTGTEDTRLNYDRCGRLVGWFGGFNDVTPYTPNWTIFVLDARRLHEELDIKPFELCMHRYKDRIMTHLIDNQHDGHEDVWAKNHNELNYGYSYGDIAAMLSFIHLFDKEIVLNKLDNTYYLTQDQYDRIKDEILKTWKSEKDQKEITFHPIYEYLNDSPVVLKSTSPLVFSRGSIQFDERPQSYQEVIQSNDYNETILLRGNLKENRMYNKDHVTGTITFNQDFIKKNLQNRGKKNNAQSSLQQTEILGLDGNEYRYPTDIPIGLNPSTYINDLSYANSRFKSIEENAKRPKMKTKKQPQMIKQTAFSLCMLKYHKIRPYEYPTPHDLEHIHSATNPILIHISDQDWGFGSRDGDLAVKNASGKSFSNKSDQNDQNDANDAKKNMTKKSEKMKPKPFPTLTLPNPIPPYQSQYPSWVYVSITHDKGGGLYYRPVVTFINAITMELVAIQPLQFKTPNKCNTSDHCDNGVGSGCTRCTWIYTHTLFVNDTPLSFSIKREKKDDEQDGEKREKNAQNQENQENQESEETIVKNKGERTTKKFPSFEQSTHTVLPTFHTLDSQFFASINIDDFYAWVQELDIRSLWMNRFDCNQPIAISSPSTSFSPMNINQQDNTIKHLDGKDTLITLGNMMIKEPKDNQNPQPPTVQSLNIPTRYDFVPQYQPYENVLIPSLLSNNEIARYQLVKKTKITPPLLDDSITLYLSTLFHTHSLYLNSLQIQCPHPDCQAKWIKHDWRQEDDVMVVVEPQTTPRRLSLGGGLQKEFEFFYWDLHNKRLKDNGELNLIVTKQIKAVVVEQDDLWAIGSWEVDGNDLIMYLFFTWLIVLIIRSICFLHDSCPPYNDWDCFDDDDRDDDCDDDCEDNKTRKDGYGK